MNYGATSAEPGHGVSVKEFAGLGPRNGKGMLALAVAI